MPWKECHVMDERLWFVARLLEGEKMAPLCAEFGISRKTGYKIYDRYKDCGVGAFSDRSRRPHRQANRLPAPIEATIVRLKREYPGWGAPKIREKLRRHMFSRMMRVSEGGCMPRFPAICPEKMDERRASRCSFLIAFALSLQHRQMRQTKRQGRRGRYSWRPRSCVAK